MDSWWIVEPSTAEWRCAWATLSQEQATNIDRMMLMSADAEAYYFKDGWTRQGKRVPRPEGCQCHTNAYGRTLTFMWSTASSSAKR